MGGPTPALPLPRTPRTQCKPCSVPHCLAYNDNGDLTRPPCDCIDCEPGWFSNEEGTVRGGASKFGAACCGRVRHGRRRSAQKPLTDPPPLHCLCRLQCTDCGVENCASYGSCCLCDECKNGYQLNVTTGTVRSISRSPESSISCQPAPLGGTLPLLPACLAARAGRRHPAVAKRASAPLIHFPAVRRHVRHRKLPHLLLHGLQVRRVRPRLLAHPGRHTGEHAHSAPKECLPPATAVRAALTPCPAVCPSVCCSARRAASQTVCTTSRAAVRATSAFLASGPTRLATRWARKDRHLAGSALLVGAPPTPPSDANSTSACRCLPCSARPVACPIVSATSPAASARPAPPAGSPQTGWCVLWRLALSQLGRRVRAEDPLRKRPAHLFTPCPPSAARAPPGRACSAFRSSRHPARAASTSQRRAASTARSITRPAAPPASTPPGFWTGRTACAGRRAARRCGRAAGSATTRASAKSATGAVRCGREGARRRWERRKCWLLAGLQARSHPSVSPAPSSCARAVQARVQAGARAQAAVRPPGPSLQQAR